MRWNGKYWELPHKHHTTMPDDQQEISKQLRLFFVKYTQAMGDVMAQKGVLMDTLAMLASRLSTESQIEVRNFLELVHATEAAHVQFFERLYQG